MTTKHGACGVVVSQGSISLVYREKEVKKYYVFPGGGIEEGEAPEEAVVREFAEETNITVKPIRPIYYINYDDNTDRVYFLCDYISGTPKLQKNTNEFERMQTEEGQYYEPKWLPLARLNETIVFPLQIRDLVIEDIKNSFNQEQKRLSIVRAIERQV